MSAPLPPHRQFGRAGYRDIVSYPPEPRPCAIELTDNTNLWGTPPSADRALREAPLSSITRYPEAYTESLKEAIGQYVGVPSDMIVTGCGSDDVLDCAMRACAEPGETLAAPDPTFSMVPLLARANSLHVVRVPVTREGDIDAERLAATRAAITYVCSPNNPTGRGVARNDLDRIVAATPGLVIIDEAYAEYQGHSAIDIALRHEHVLVTRTMSKAFGLAGLRVGYGVGHPALIAEIEKARGPFKVTAPATLAAIAVLVNDLDWVNRCVTETLENRERLIDALRSLGLAPIESQANFVLVPVSSANALAAAMRRRDIGVRPFTKLTSIGDAMRITVGPWEMMASAIEAFREALVECA